MTNNSKEQTMRNNLFKELEAYNEHYIYLEELVSMCNDFDKFDSARNKAPNSMRILESACVDAMMMEFARFYDNDKNAKSVLTLLEECANNGNSSLFQDKNRVLLKIDEFEKEIQTNEYISTGISTLKMRRDKYFAHNDKKYFVNQEKDNSYLPMYKLWFMKEFIKKVIHYLYSELGGNVESLEKPIYNADLINI